MKISEVTRVLDLPNVRQMDDYDCGPAAVRSVLGYYGIESVEKDVIRATKTSKKWGAEPDDMENALKAMGLEVFQKSGMTVDELRLCTQRRIPVIVAIQAWGDRDDYSDDWDDGHYVVVKGVDDSVVRIEDPSSDSESQLPIEEFEERWRGWDDPYVRWGMIVGPGTRKVDPIHRWVKKPG